MRVCQFNTLEFVYSIIVVGTPIVLVGVPVCLFLEVPYLSMRYLT